MLTKCYQNHLYMNTWVLQENANLLKFFLYTFVLLKYNVHIKEESVVFSNVCSAIVRKIIKIIPNCLKADYIFTASSKCRMFIVKNTHVDSFCDDHIFGRFLFITSFTFHYILSQKTPPPT